MATRSSTAEPPPKGSNPMAARQITAETWREGSFLNLGEEQHGRASGGGLCPDCGEPAALRPSCRGTAEQLQEGSVTMAARRSTAEQRRKGSAPWPPERLPRLLLGVS